MRDNSWGFAQVWNASLEKREERPMVPRNHLWASELTKSPIEIWLKFRATPYSNPPNARSLRKFEAGDVFEWIVSLILKRAGILKDAQGRMEFQYPGLLKVTGKFDFLAGGKPDVDKFMSELSALNLPEVFLRAGEAVTKAIAERFPDGLEEMPLEIKSVSSFAFEAIEARDQAQKAHRLQIYHYLKAGQFKKGHIVYICRDDLRVSEYVVELGGETEEEYRTAIEGLSKTALLETMPEKEKEIIFDEDYNKFSRNFNVCYSPYLTLVYGYKDQMQFEERVVPVVNKWNRVMARVKAGAKMTKKNEEVLEEITVAGFDLETIKAKFPTVPVVEDLES